MDFLNLNRRHKVGLLIVLAGAGLCLLLDASAKQATGFVLLGLAGTWILGSLRPRTLWLLASLSLFAIGLSIATVPVWTDWSSYKASVQDYDAAIADLRQGVASRNDNDNQEFTNIRPLGDDEQKPREDYAKNKQTQEHGPWENYALPKGAPIPKGATIGKPTKGLPANGKHKAPDTITLDEPYRGKLPSTQTVEIEIPDSTQRWVRHDANDPYAKFWVPVLTFDRNVSDEEIVSSIQTKQLLPRPTFSIWASARSHRFASVSGAALALCGLLVSAWVILGRRTRTP